MTRAAERFRAGSAVFWGLVVLLAGCGGESPDAEVAVDTLESGAVRVRSSGPTEWSEPAGGWSVHLRTEIAASADDDPPFLLSYVRDLEIDAYGRVYVLDNQSHTIGVFDTTGAYVRTIGREGQGPGEFRRPDGMTWGAGGHLWVSDPLNARYSVFDTAGALVRRVQRRLTSWRWQWDAVFGPEGRLLETDLLREPDSEESTLTAVRFDVSGEEAVPTDTFRIPRPPETTPGFGVAREGASGYVQVPFAPRHLLRFDGRGGMWTGTGADFRLLRTTVSGDTTRIAEWTGERPPVPEAAVDDWKRSIEEDWGARSLLEMDLSRIPGVKPAFTTFFLDDRRHVWAARSHGVGVYREYADSIVFDVLDAEGRWLGPVTVQRGLSLGVPPAFRGSWMAGVTTGEMDLPTVVVFRVER